MDEILLEVTEDVGERVDKWIIKSRSDLSRTLLQRLMSDGLVTVNGKPTAKSLKLKEGDRVKIILPEPKLLETLPEEIPIEIVYEDAHLLVINKPKGMVVHPAPGHYSGTLVNALLYHCEGRLSSINGVIRPGIVHRIDKDTSGLLVAAKTDKAHTGLAEQIKEHTFTRQYFAIAHGISKEKNGTVDAPLGRSIKDRKKMCVTEKNSKPAKTEYEVIEDYGNYSLLKLTLHTGRTHQIRVHMSYIGHYILGDEVYGKPSKYCAGQCLHAKKIGFIHPVTQELMEFDSVLPDYFLQVLDILRRV
ncbi:MAG: RluA family pseudouridine synthase [Oscillospiraceae bacterium]|nr:RluA family pseudouridine synthase [Oscillospiraceae bacterium]